jgi:hypothetical protein
MKKIYTRTALRHPHTMALNLTWCFPVILSVTVFVWNYLCEERGAENGDLRTENGERKAFSFQISVFSFSKLYTSIKGNFQKKTGTVSERVSVSSNRGTEWGLSERLCYAMLLLREASCLIPSIGTSRHERRVCDGRAMCLHSRAEGANELSALCRAFL